MFSSWFYGKHELRSAFLYCMPSIFTRKLVYEWHDQVESNGIWIWFCTMPFFLFQLPFFSLTRRYLSIINHNISKQTVINININDYPDSPVNIIEFCNKSLIHEFCFILFHSFLIQMSNQKYFRNMICGWGLGYWYPWLINDNDSMLFRFKHFHFRKNKYVPVTAAAINDDVPLSFCTF